MPLKNGVTLGLTAKMAIAARMLVEGQELDNVCIACFDVRDESGNYRDPKKMTRARRIVRNWMKAPEFLEFYRGLIQEAAFGYYGKALSRIKLQIDDKNQWLANKAANDILNRFDPYITGKDDKSVTIKIEGMPEIGTPGEMTPNDG